MMCNSAEEFYYENSDDLIDIDMFELAEKYNAYVKSMEICKYCKHWTDTEAEYYGVTCRIWKSNRNYNDGCNKFHEKSVVI